jgi:hypothetical protein
VADEAAAQPFSAEVRCVASRGRDEFPAVSGLTMVTKNSRMRKIAVQRAMVENTVTAGSLAVEAFLFKSERRAVKKDLDQGGAPFARSRNF